MPKKERCTECGSVKNHEGQCTNRQCDWYGENVSDGSLNEVDFPDDDQENWYGKNTDRYNDFTEEYNL